MVEVIDADREAAKEAEHFLDGCGCDVCLQKAAEVFARHRIAAAQAERAAVVEWLRKLAGVPASALEGHPPRGEVWVLHRSADAIEAGEHRA